MSDDEFFHKEKDNNRYLQKVKEKQYSMTPNIQKEETQNFYSINRESYRESIHSAQQIKEKSQDKIQDQSDESDEEIDDTESVLSEISNESIYFESKVGYQKRALFRKNLTLQWRQKCTNICQLITPILGLFLVILVQTLASSSFDKYSDKAIFLPFPYIFGLNYQPLSNFGDMIDISSCNQWYMFEFQDQVSSEQKTFFGQNEGQPWSNPLSSGMLSNKNLLVQPCPDVNKTVPYFYEFSQSKYKVPTMDDFLFKGVEALTTAEYNFGDKNPQIKEVEQLPDGAYSIFEVTPQKLKYNVQINDCKYWQYHRDNGVTKIGIIDHEQNVTQYVYRVQEGQLNAADIINQAYMRTLFNDTTVVSGVQYFPFKTNFEKDLSRSVSVMGGLVFPICMCMCLPVFLYYIVLEKETRLIETMKTNGMRMKNYWIVNFLFNMLLYSIQASVFFIFGRYIYKIELFVETNTFLQILCLFGWGLAQTSLAFFFSVFLSKAQTASIIGYAISIWFTTVAAVLNVSMFSPPNKMDWYLFALPPFTFARLYFHMCGQCAYETCLAAVSGLPSEMTIALVMLYLSSAIFLLLALYLQQVIPQQYGVAKPWNFLCKRQKKKKQLHHRDTDEVGDLEEEREQNETAIFDFDLNLEDSDAKAERNMVYNLAKTDYYKYPLIIKDLRKVYPGFGGRPPKIATKNFCLRIKKGEMFGLLGPNGAGKTTLISMLTGLYKPNSGNAWVAGYALKDQLDVVQLQIGVCPQFDVLWADLTVEEHLYFYARLKGIPPDRESDQVKKAISQVLLEKFKNFTVKQLSGGMKRRLSVAISMVSDPKIIYLDEPSTGLDPENRRQLWDILSAQKGNRAIVLTTHSMEEADVLCNRIGIVSDGILRCVGPQVRLKSIYGGGYHLFINSQKGKVLQIMKEVKKKRQKKILRDQKKKKPLVEIISHPSQNNHIKEEYKQQDILSDEEEEELDLDEIKQRIIDFVKNLQPNAILIREFNGNFVYQIPLEGFNAESMFIDMERNRQRLRITDWGISQCSLEDVFNRICEN